MAGLMDLLNSDLGKQIISSVSGQVGTNENETGSVLASVLPALVGGMMNNAQTPDGQSGLLGALLGGKHGGLLDNLSGMFGNDVQEDGGKILGHVLGNENQQNLQNQVSQNTGVSSDKIAMIMKIAAPILMAYLSKKAMSSGLDANNQAASGGGLSDILGGLLGGGQSQGQPSGNGNVLTSMLDQDGDGELGIGDAVSAMNKKGGLGGLLGGLFGGK